MNRTYIEKKQEQIPVNQFEQSTKCLFILNKILLNKNVLLNNNINNVVLNRNVLLNKN